jgi:UDP-N-acetylglucosamine:LPS N-acetylglucosamine transferase
LKSMNGSKELMVCLAASAGGHLTQLLRLEPVWIGYDTFCVTTVNAVRQRLEKYGRTYVVGECNHQHPIKVLLVLARCIKIIFKEKPDVIIRTGAAAGCMSCFLTKILGGKVVWVDSITNVDRISLSGYMVRHIADLFLVQWPELAQKYNDVEYVGTLI